MNDAPVEIAVVGHTNTGKTSLLRTLTRDASFGEVSSRPATTRDVSGVMLLAESEPVVALYDTPGLEDAMGVAAHLDARRAGHADALAGIEAFLAGDHDRGRYEQEAKVLRQMLRSDAAIYVIDAREPVAAKHREELRLLAACGRPLMPLLNFVASDEADAATWKRQLARLGLHVLAEFDTVVLDHDAEQRIFEKLGVLLESRRAQFQRLLEARAEAREALVASACRAVATLLVDAAALRVRGALDAPVEPLAARLRETVRGAEQSCVETLLGLFRFDLETYAPPALPLEHGRWRLDPFDPETLRSFGVRTGSAAVAGGMTGLAIDAMTGGVTLGAAAAIGAALGAVGSTAHTFGRPLLDRIRGQQVLVLEEPTLALLAARQMLLLNALLRRGHAACEPVRSGVARGWPSKAVRTATLRCRNHPAWSSLNEEVDASRASVAGEQVAATLRATLGEA